MRGLRVVEAGCAFIEDIVFQDRAAERQLAPERRNIFNVFAQGDLGLQQLVAGVTVCRAFAGKLNRVQGSSSGRLPPRGENLRQDQSINEDQEDL